MSDLSQSGQGKPADGGLLDATLVRRLVLETAHRAGVGHIGSALSVVEILCVLYSGVMRISAPNDPERDRLILAKGHAALALYAVLVATGILPRERLAEYCQDGGALGVHPERGTPGVDFSTGSLGHGLSYGVGAAYSARLQRSARHAFVLLSDAELNAGSVWEAVQFAAHHRLGRLTAIVDANGVQAFGKTRDVIQLEPLSERFAAFGWNAVEVSGHDRQALSRALSPRAEDRDAPRVVIARTTLGKGVSFMEGQIPWHYLPLSDELYRRACADIEEEGT